MSDELLTIEDVMARLKLGRTKIYELINRGELRHIKIDRATRIPESELAALIARKLQEAAHA